MTFRGAGVAILIAACVAFCASSMTRPWSGPELKHQGPRQSGLVCRTGGGAGERAEGVSMAAINEQSNSDWSLSRDHGLDHASNNNNNISTYQPGLIFPVLPATAVYRYQIKTGTAGWAQRTITVTAPSRGCHLITSEISKQVPELRSFRVGMANIFLKHTSASLTINENADPDVRTDMEAALNQIVPVKWHDTMFRHTLEGPDDMTGHVKSTIVGASLNIPVSNGCLALGTWQGVYLCEHRDTGGWGGGFARDIVITINGVTAD